MRPPIYTCLYNYTHIAYAEPERAVEQNVYLWALSIWYGVIGPLQRRNRLIFNFCDICLLSGNNQLQKDLFQIHWLLKFRQSVKMTSINSSSYVICIHGNEPNTHLSSIHKMGWWKNKVSNNATMDVREFNHEVKVSHIWCIYNIYICVCMLNLN